MRVPTPRRIISRQCLTPDVENVKPLITSCVSVDPGLTTGEDGKEGKPDFIRTTIVWKRVAQSCLTLCNLTDCSPPGSSVYGIFQAQYWSGLLFPSSGALSDPGIKPTSPAFQSDPLLSEPSGYGELLSSPANVLYIFGSL